MREDIRKLIPVDYDWSEVDQLIRDVSPGSAVLFLRKQLGISINQGIETVDNRQREIGVVYPCLQGESTEFIHEALKKAAPVRHRINRIRVDADMDTFFYGGWITAILGDPNVEEQEELLALGGGRCEIGWPKRVGQEIARRLEVPFEFIEY